MEKKHNTWNTLYSDYINNDFKNWDEYFRTKMKLKKPFFNLIVKYSIDGKPVLECGSGTGKFSVYLASLGYTAYAIDLEPAMVEQTKVLSQNICPKNPVHVLHGDISQIPFPDKYFSLTHSSGVLEHFPDEKIVALINEQLRVANTVIFSVPSPYFEQKMLGDERFMSRKEWREIISNSNAEIKEESGYHYKPIGKRIVDIIEKPKRILKPIALFTFVLKERQR